MEDIQIRISVVIMEEDLKDIVHPVTNNEEVVFNAYKYRAYLYNLRVANSNHIDTIGEALSFRVLVTEDVEVSIESSLIYLEVCDAASWELTIKPRQ